MGIKNISTYNHIYNSISKYIKENIVYVNTDINYLNSINVNNSSSFNVNNINQTNVVSLDTNLTIKNFTKDDFKDNLKNQLIKDLNTEGISVFSLISNIENNILDNLTDTVDNTIKNITKTNLDNVLKQINEFKTDNINIIVVEGSINQNNVSKIISTFILQNNNISNSIKNLSTFIDNKSILVEKNALEQLILSITKLVSVNFLGILGMMLAAFMFLVCLKKLTPSIFKIIKSFYKKN